MPNKKIKIAWLHTHIQNQTGGSRYIFEVTKRLNQKYPLTLFVEKINPSWRHQFEKENIEVISYLPISSDSPFYWLFLPIILPFTYFKLRSQINQSDLIISSMFPQNILANSFSIPQIQICFEPFAFFYDQSFIKDFSLLKRLFIKFLTLLYSPLDISATRKSNFLLALNPDKAKWIKSIYHRRVDGITQIGVDLSFFKPKIDKTLKRKYKKHKLIFHSTNFTPTKGTQYILKALPLVIKKNPHTLLLISSTLKDPQGKAKLKSLARNLKLNSNVKFLNTIPYNLLPYYYSLADLYVFAGDPRSKGASNTSLSVIESLACATPVIRSPGNQDEVVDSKSGIIVNPHSPQQLAKKINFLLSHPQRAHQMGQWGRRYVTSHYSWETITQNLISFIQSHHL